MEFKEILSYTKKWWWLVLLLAVGGGAMAYWLYDVLPNQRAKTTYSAQSRFETPRDNLRVIKQGENVLRVRVDIKSELYAVQSDDNREQAARYYALIENAIESGKFAGGDASTPFESEAYRQYLRDLEKLAGEPMSRNVDIYDPSTLHPKEGAAPKKPTNFRAEPLLSKTSAARDRLKQLSVTAETIPSTRVVEIRISGASSNEEARMWADALVLAAIRESFERHISSFEAKIEREAKAKEARQEPLSDAKIVELQKAAQDRLSSVEALHPLDPNVDINEITVDPIGIPDFRDVTATNADIRRLAYYKHMRAMIEDLQRKNYGNVVAAIGNGVAWDTTYISTIQEFREQRRNLLAARRTPQSLVKNQYPAELKLFNEEKAKYEAVLALGDDNAIEKYRPNRTVVTSTQISRAQNDIASLNRQIQSKLASMTEENLEVRSLRNEKTIALDSYKTALHDAFLARETALSAQIELETARLEQIERQLKDVEAGLAFSKADLNRLNAIASLYSESLRQISEANDRILIDDQKIAGYRANLNEQTAILEASSFSAPAQATSIKSNRMSVSVIVGLIILVGSSVMIYVMMLARNKIATEYDIRRHVNLPVLAKMAKRPESEKSLLTISPRSAAAEAFSTLATQVRSYARELSLRSLLVTSGVKSEGKTDVTCNLAVALARKGLSVLVIDADLHRPRVSDFFGVSASHGLIQFVQEQHDADIIDFVMPTYEGGPDLLLPGGEAQDPVRLLESDAFKSMLKQAEREYDIVLFDSPPVARVGDALIVGAETDATLMVCCAGVVTFADAALAKRLLTNIQANLLGVVLNNATDISAREYYNYYSYGDRTRRRVRKVFD